LNEAGGLYLRARANADEAGGQTMRSRLLLGLLICGLASCAEDYSERVISCPSVREVLIRHMLQVYADMGCALETDRRYPGPAANPDGLRDSFIVGSKGPLKIMSTFRRQRAETAVEVRVYRAGLSRQGLDRIRDEVISRFEAKMEAR
jgi:hypothetical protein